MLIVLVDTDDWACVVFMWVVTREPRYKTDREKYVFQNPDD